jgi:hypothetical protein
MGNGALAIGPKLPRPSSTLPTLPSRVLLAMSASWGGAAVSAGDLKDRSWWSRVEAPFRRVSYVTDHAIDRTYTPDRNCHDTFVFFYRSELPRTKTVSIAIY